MDWNRTIFSLLLAVSLLTGNWRPVEPASPTPQPDPFSDRYPVEIVVDNRHDYQYVLDHLYDVDTVQTLDPTRILATGEEFKPLRVVAYINPVEAGLLQRAGLSATPIVNESRVAASLYGPGLDAPNTWPTYETFVARWQALADAHPEIVQMNNIGSSVQGRSIWCLKITDNPNLQENEPEVKFSAAIHGDEATGIELTTRLAELLVTGYGSDPRVTGLVDNLETWLCPIHNPDGYVNSSRYNANGKDLNRNFPDPVSDPVDTIAGREIENVAFMQLGYANRFRLGINYHGGASVVNYPLDSKPLSPPYYAPDNDLFHDLSIDYASLNPTILHGGFTDGVTVGWEWYIITGGMQDWAYNWRDELHVTIEVSSVKKPAFTDMDAYWGDNQEAMLVWMERALTGAAGLVTDAATGLPLDAVIKTSDNLKTIRTDPEVGDYHRLLLPGVYTLTATASCHVSANAEVIVPNGGQVMQDFNLQPTGISGDLSDSISGTGIAGTVSIVETGQVVASDPATGAYSISLCPGQYTLQVVAEGYESIERHVTLADLLVEDFSLTGVNLLKIYLPVIVQAEN
jgi:hypothetical protein